MSLIPGDEAVTFAIEERQSILNQAGTESCRQKVMKEGRWLNEYPLEGKETKV